MSYVLIVVTYLGGSAWGPQVAMQEFSSASHCEAARDEVRRAINQLNRSNMAGGSLRREILNAKCVQR